MNQHPDSLDQSHSAAKRYGNQSQPTTGNANADQKKKRIRKRRGGCADTHTFVINTEQSSATKTLITRIKNNSSRGFGEEVTSDEMHSNAKQKNIFAASEQRKVDNQNYYPKNAPSFKKQEAGPRFKDRNNFQSHNSGESSNHGEMDIIQNEDPNNTRELFDCNDKLLETLKQPILEGKIVTNILKAIAKRILTQPQLEDLDPFLEKILHSQLFPRHLVTHASTLLIQNSDLNDIVADLITIFQSILSRKPNLAYEKLNICIKIYSNTLEEAAGKGIQLKSENVDKLKSIREQIETVQGHEKIIEKKHAERPPNDYKLLPIIPALNEIVSEIKPNLKENLVEGIYSNVNDYLDIHFRLLREEYVAPLKYRICEYLKTDAKSDGKRQQHQGLRLYLGVRIIKPIYTFDGVCYEIKFDTQPFQRIKWEMTRRLILGSLLCLSDDNFKTVKFATIVKREVETLKLGILTIKMETETDSFVVLTEHEMRSLYIMAESPACFDQCRSILQSLKTISSETMPFQDYLIQANKEHRVPAYLDDTSPHNLASTPEKARNSSETHKNTIYDGHHHNMATSDQVAGAPAPKITELISLPSAALLGCDESQRSAMHLALTSSLAVIQGPPGTGKTFVGTKIVDFLLANNSSITPILIVCSTNKTLDKFLKGILKFTQSVMRVGGPTQNEELRSCDIRQKVHGISKSACNLETSKLQGLYVELSDLQAKINDAENLLQRWDSVILHEELLKQLPTLDADLVATLVADYVPVVGNKSRLQSWLGIFFNYAVDESELVEFFFSDQDENLEEIVATSDPTKAKELDDGKEENLIHVENEATVETKNRMLFREDNFSADKIFSKSKFVLEHGVLEVENIRGQHLITDDDSKGNENGGNEILEDICLIRYNIVKRELAKKDLMDYNEAAVAAEINLWGMTLRDRWRLYRRWRYLYQQELKKSINRMQREYDQKRKDWSHYQSQEEYELLKNCKVIGMTNAGVAKYQTLLQKIGCKIVIIEEAAKFLESQVITTVNSATEQLILIGDHQQLGPKTTVQYLSKQYKLDDSLFERLIINGLPYATLQEQYRMRPEISQIIRQHFYPDLKDHKAVLTYPSVLGMAHNIFFLNHSHDKAAASGSKTNRNTFEARFVVAISRYLLQQGYSPSQITILAMSMGQVYTIRNYMPRDEFEGVRVTTVHNYQDEENDIILLSFVSSIAEVNAGFLKIENLSNVALTRARQGLYAIGDFELLAQTSNLWQQLAADLKDKNFMGPAISISCQNHPETRQVITVAEDFQQLAPIGRCLCLRTCCKTLHCGHVCKRVCHFAEHGPCKDPCQKTCPLNHPCPLLCHQGCKPCEFILEKRMKCGHMARMACGSDPDEHKCRIIVEKILPLCQHTKQACCHENINTLVCVEPCQRKICTLNHAEEKCKNLCYENCSSCTILVKKYLPCNHLVLSECGQKITTCQERCKFKLKCGHECDLLCHAGKNEKHEGVICKKSCQRKICTLYHAEEKCKNLCYENCSSCTVLVKKYLPCNHHVLSECGQKITICQERCTFKLKCGHECDLLCHAGKNEKHEGIICKKSCQKIVCKRLFHPNEMCKNLCHEVCSSCTAHVTRILPCGHVVRYECGQTSIKCDQQCKRTLSCGHRCKDQCGNPCGECGELIDKPLPCSHSIKIKCNLSNVPARDTGSRTNVSIWAKIVGLFSPTSNRPPDLKDKCNNPCNKILPCGHECQKLCMEECTISCKKIVKITALCGHDLTVPCYQRKQYEDEKNKFCNEPCKKVLSCGHECRKLCMEECTCKKIVKIKALCGHVLTAPCSQREQYKNKRIMFCNEPCRKRLSCGHECRELCKDNCTTICTTIVNVKGLCGHDISVSCYLQKQNKYEENLQCQEPCRQVLHCGHECSGSCQLCRQGRVHVVCKNKCGRVQICGHVCDIPCAEMCPPCNKPCTTQCEHSQCPKRCGQPCVPCTEKCEWKCPHYECSRRCGEYCDRSRCNEPCLKLLACGHPCMGLCGEACPLLCRICRPDEIKDLLLFGNEDDEDSRFVRLEDCGHYIEVEGLDQWMDMKSDEIQMKSCPMCKTPIWRSHRYGNIIRNCLENVQAVKRKVFGSLEDQREHMKRLLSSLNNTPEIQKIFTDHDMSLRTRLRQNAILHYNACNVIENQILLLAGMCKAIQNNNRGYASVDGYLTVSLNSLANRLMENEERMTEHELDSINRELRRITLVASLIGIEEIYLKNRVTNSWMYPKLTVIKSKLLTASRLTDAAENDLNTKISDLKRMGGLGISEEERVMIVKAISLGQGRWFKCPNGHIYVIGECGGAMETATCNECGSAIGGTSHNLLSTNVHAGEMDGSKFPAWSTAADLANFDPREYR